MGCPHTKELIRILCAPTDALTRQGRIPVLRDGLARKERKEKESSAPHGRDNDHSPDALARQAILGRTSRSRCLSEEAHILEENGQLDEGGAGAISSVAGPDMLL